MWWITGDVLLNSNFVDCFKEFHVIMSSSEQENAVLLHILPDNIKMPKKVPVRERARVKRIKTYGVRNRNNLKVKTTAGRGRLQCTVCRQTGHNQTTCPARKEFADKSVKKKFRVISGHSGM
jgi:hypothetical protein